MNSPHYSNCCKGSTSDNDTLFSGHNVSQSYQVTSSYVHFQYIRPTIVVTVMVMMLAIR